MKVIARLGVSYSNEKQTRPTIESAMKLRETTKNVSSGREPISVQSAKGREKTKQNKTKQKSTNNFGYGISNIDSDKYMLYKMTY